MYNNKYNENKTNKREQELILAEEVRKIEQKHSDNNQIEKLQTYILRLEEAVIGNNKELIKEMEIRIIDMYYMK